MINLKTMQDIDCNYLFYQNYFKLCKKQQTKNLEKIIQKGRKIQKKFNELDEGEKQQWHQIIYNKIDQLFQSSKYAQLFECVYVLVFICCSFNSTCGVIQVQYNKQQITQIIKTIYFQKHGDQILDVFKASKFNFQQFQTWDYDDPWFTKIWKKIWD